MLYGHKIYEERRAYSCATSVSILRESKEGYKETKVFLSEDISLGNGNAFLLWEIEVLTF